MYISPGPGRRESHALGRLEDARRAAADVGTRGGARGGLVRADLGRAVAVEMVNPQGKPRENLHKPREN